MVVKPQCMVEETPLYCRPQRLVVKRPLGFNYHTVGFNYHNLWPVVYKVIAFDQLIQQIIVCIQ